MSNAVEYLWKVAMERCPDYTKTELMGVPVAQIPIEIAPHVIAWMIQEAGGVFAIKSDVPNHGPCVRCGKDVHHAYPWWTGNPQKHSSKPVHDECLSIIFGK